MKKLLTIIAILTVGLVNAQISFTLSSSIDTTDKIGAMAGVSYSSTSIPQDTLYVVEGSTVQIKCIFGSQYNNGSFLRINTINVPPNTPGGILYTNADLMLSWVSGIGPVLTWTNVPTQSINKQFAYYYNEYRYFKVYIKVIPITTTITISTLSQITNTSSISTIDTTNCVVIHSNTLNTTYTTQSANNTVSLTLTGNTQTLTTIGASTTIPFSNTLTVIKYRFNQSNNQWFNYPKTFIYSNTLTIIGNSLPQNTVSINTTTNALQLHPHLSIISNSANLCIGGTSTLTVSGANTYTWSTNENGINISVSPTVITTYTVSGTDNKGCVGTASITAIDCSTITGIAAYINNNQIKIYPNPANLYVNIENSNNQTIEFINLNGQTVLKSTESIVNIESLKQGIYFVKCGNSITKLVKN